MRKPPPAAVKGSIQSASAIPHELQHFDYLPDSAHVRLPVVKALFACSSSSVWRNVKAGHIPAPVKLTPSVTGWNVGQIRAALNRSAA